MTVDQKSDLADETSTAQFEDEVSETDDRETADATALSATEKEPRSGGRSVLRAIKSRIVPILLGVALVASAALASTLYFTVYRADQQTDAQAAKAAVQAASDGTVALLSYAPDTLDHDFTNAKTHLTGDFLSYYTDFTTKVVTPAAQQKKVKTSAKVVQGAVSELKPDSAVVLLFINQTTTSQDIPDAAFAVSSVKVGMTKIHGNWLISSFDPV